MLNGVEHTLYRSEHVIWSHKAAGVWAEGYPIGNGRLGGMVLGMPCCDRIGLNHDRLWRRYYRYEDKGIAELFGEFRTGCQAEQWDDAFDVVKGKLARQGQCIYVNPFVPVGDLGIYMHQGASQEILDYRRTLDLDQGITELAYEVNGVRYKREYFASWPAGVIAVHISADRAASCSGEISLYRLLDRECQIAGQSSLNEVVMEGCFEEGVRFACVARVIPKGGRLTSGLKEYVAPSGETPDREMSGFTFGFRDLPHPSEPCGVSTCFDSADEVLVLLAIATDHEASEDVVGYCRRKLDQTPTDYRRLKSEHIANHQHLYRRVSLNLGDEQGQDEATDIIVEKAVAEGKVRPAIHQKMFHLGRYLAIAAGRPQQTDGVFKAPMNLQGIWNEDRRPAWDCDYHLDLNLEMCYWGLGQVNLAELGTPLVEWAYALLEQAQRAARDIYGVSGACYSAVCDAENIGNLDDLFSLATGTNAWLAQSLWQVWQYCGDVDQLKDRIYPILREIGRFYAEFLVQDDRGRLLCVPSGSPENVPAGRTWGGMLSVTATFDLELVRELFEHLCQAANVLNIDMDKVGSWQQILDRLPLPTLNKEGRLLEWLDKEYEVVDPGHRHRSHLVGICPGERITEEDTPEYNEGACKALRHRLSFGTNASCSLDKASDAQILARLYRGNDALEKLNSIIAGQTMGNLLLCLCDWREGQHLRWFGDRKVFQIEASFGVMASVVEMLLQDRRGLIRLLPALPKEWGTGEVTGLRARGGFEVSIRWQHGLLVEARITSLFGYRCRVKCSHPTGNMNLQIGDTHSRLTARDAIVEFDTIACGEYILTPA